MREYYIIVNNKRVYVTREVWQAHNAYVNHIHYEANRDRGHKRCWAGRRQSAVCTGDCYTCYYWSPNGVFVDVLTDRNDSRIGIRGYQDPQMLLRCVEIVDIAAVLGIPVSTLRDRLRRIGRRIKGE